MPRILCFLLLTIALSLPGVPSKAEEGPSPEDVAFVQGMLLRFGYNPGPIDGICGNQTTAAVRAFHTDRELPLLPGKIEPQAATVVKNLTSHLTSHVLEPVSTPPKVYEKALSGDAEAARKVGTMYRNGDNVAADEMMAYAWWSVAETYGSSEASALKQNLEAGGDITPHEVTFATALAKEICASADLKNGKTPEAVETSDDERGREVTM